MKSIGNNLGEKLKDLRVHHQLTQKRLASILNVSSQSISAYETGRAQPDIETLLAYTKVFHLSLDYFDFLHEDAILFKISPRERQLIQNYRLLPEAKQKALFELSQPVTKNTLLVHDHLPYKPYNKKK